MSEFSSALTHAEPPQSASWILSVAIPRPLEGLFTYRLPGGWEKKIQVGGWVKVPFGRVQTHAYIVEAPKLISELPASLDQSKLKWVSEVGSEEPVFTEDTLQLCQWASQYYRAPLGEVLQTAVPASVLGLRTAKKTARAWARKNHETETPWSLNEQQEAAVALLDQGRLSKPGSTALLWGVTGSGKTEVYLTLARRVLAEGKGVLLLVPEIALTPQLHERLERGLGAAVGLWHSAMPAGKRRDLGAALRAGDLRVVVGARSAVFAPIPNLGLIVVDEEHDPTYKQEDRFRYHARDLAVVRSKTAGAYTILGSATPSLETRERVRDGRYQLARLTQRIAPGGLPKIELIDLSQEERHPEARFPLARKAAEEIQQTLNRGEQVMVFLNRRGYAAFLVCEACGETPGCPSCSISLTYHKKRAELRCHLCGHQEAAPDHCKKCNGYDLAPIGAGTESVEETFGQLFQDVKLLRLDRDVVTSASRLDQILRDFRDQKANLLLGTQMLVKGHDFPGVTLVVVLLADALFRWPDFRAPERAYQILLQVAGRAGRGSVPGRVLIQTFQPEHPVLQTLVGTQTEEAFIESERSLREALGYPPFRRMARIRVEDPQNLRAQQASQRLADELLRQGNATEMELLGPSEAFLERVKGIWRWDILLKCTQISTLQRALSFSRAWAEQNEVELVADVDPQGMG
jgi:primosomal protein N' (replication factor Y)